MCKQINGHSTISGQLQRNVQMRKKMRKMKVVSTALTLPWTRSTEFGNISLQ